MTLRRVLVCLSLVLLSATPVFADEVRMRDGTVHIGTVVDETDDVLHLRVAASTFLKTQRIKIKKDRIQHRDPEVVSIVPKLTTFIEKWSTTKGDEDLVERLELAEEAWPQRLDGWIRTLLKSYATDDPNAPFAAYMRPTPLFSTWIGPRRTKRTTASGRAARAALDWLAAHQDDDGRIDADQFMKHDPDDDKTDGAGGGHHGERVRCGFDGAVTGLAMLGWMAAGSTPVSGPYRRPIAKAVSYCRIVAQRGPGGFDQIWNFAFSVQALAEAYWLGRDASLRAVLRQAVVDAVNLQHRGGWRYMPRAVPGVPSTAAVATALGMCLRVGIPVPEPSIARIVSYFDARVDPKSGRSEYHDGAERLGYTPTRSNTAAALVACGMLNRMRKRPGLSRQLASLTKHKPTWKLEFKDVKTKDGRTVRAQIGYLYPYAWYYTDLALQLRGGSQGKGWRAALRKTLIGAQRQDGAAKGSWDPKGTYSDSGGRAFVTALGALMLLSPVRYDAN